jgi:hypothetical protein
MTNINTVSKGFVVFEQQRNGRNVITGNLTKWNSRSSAVADMQFPESYTTVRATFIQRLPNPICYPKATKIAYEVM